MSLDKLVEDFREEAPRPSSDTLHVWAVFWANFKMFLSYRTWVITEILSTTASVVMYSFMGLQVDAERVVEAGYGNVSWLAFALVGVSTANYLWVCISRLNYAMRDEISEGTFESIVASLIRMRSYIIGQSIRNFIMSGYLMLGTLLIGVFVLRVPLILTFGTALSFLVVLFMMVASYLGVGIMIAGIILVYKRGNPLTILFAGLTEFLGGVLFPLNYLKDYPILWTLAWLMPYTYALHAAREIFLNGATLTSTTVLTDLFALLVFTVVFVPIGLWVFRWGYNRIRDEGTVATY